jgi:hypothetical protein
MLYNDTFNCKIAIFESQQAFILLEMIFLLFMIALLAVSWAGLYVQSCVAEKQLLIRLQGIHSAASYIDRLRASPTFPSSGTFTDGEYILGCTIKKIFYRVWLARVQVHHARSSEEVYSVTTIGRSP